MVEQARICPHCGGGIEPPPATRLMREYAKSLVGLTFIDSMTKQKFQAFIDEWLEPAPPPAPEQPTSSPWKCAICGGRVRISDDLQPHHLASGYDHDAELSREDLKILADGLRLTD